MRGGKPGMRTGVSGAAGLTPTEVALWARGAGGATTEAGGTALWTTGAETAGVVGRTTAPAAAAGGGVTGDAGGMTVGAVAAGAEGTTRGGGVTKGTGGAGALMGVAATAGLLSTGGGATVGRAGGATGAGGACCLRMALRTSPGREICDRSILVLISSARLGRDGLAAVWLSPATARKCARTFSASCSSRELECVFFSVTPTSSRTSRIILLLTSSSLARSLIRILLIRPCFLRTVPLSLS